MLRSASDRSKKKKKNESPANGHRDSAREKRAEQSDGGKKGDAAREDEGPDASTRAKSGMKAAEHLSKAASGGTLRRGFSLWRASKHLGVAGAGAGDLVKRNPLPAALIGGTAAGIAIFFAARSMAAADDASADDESQGEDEDEADRGAEDEDSDDEQGGDAESDEDAEDDGADEE